MDIFLAIAVGIGAGTAAVLGMPLLHRATRRKGSQTEGFPDEKKPEPGDAIQFLLKDGQLVDCTDSAHALLQCGRHDRLDWAEVASALEPNFGALPTQPPDQDSVIHAPDDPATHLTMRSEGDMLSLAVNVAVPDSAERLKMLSAHKDLERFRSVMALAPYPIWHVRKDETAPNWYNSAYEDICAQIGAPPDGPVPFDAPSQGAGDSQVLRTSVGMRGTGRQFWFEVHSHRTERGVLHFAVNIDAVITSESAQRTFLQTLTRIFAHLPIGLAIFDKDRRLVLFNPALIDLTTLQPEFLSGRPNIMSFFDMLRELRIMPEPKNYQNWRGKLSELIAAASSDLYVETWSLPSGLTFKITGRPHPDGGIAFLLEDISAEVSLTRRFRQEIEITQAVLDCLDEAVAVFSQLGVLVFCNEAYRELWQSDPESGLADLGIADATAAWQTACEPSPIWSDLRDFVLTLRDRAAWEAELHLKAGARVHCRVEPVAGGATLIRFSRMPDLPATLRLERNLPA